MKIRTTSPTETVLQVSGETARGEPVLSVLVKRTYRVDARGRADFDVPQLPLSAAEVDPSRQAFLIRDADVYPVKPLTDIVVIGHAYGPGKSASFTAELRAGKVQKALRVTGDRRAALEGTRILFSDPEPVDRVPLSCDRAYGGRDSAAEARHGLPWEALQPYLPKEMDVRAHSPYLYPRNPWGRGYVVEATRESLEGLALPNLEDPEDLLTPDRLVASSVGRWPERPLPWYLGWQSHAAFPRIAYTGAARPFDPPPGGFAEVARGLAPPGFPRLGPVREVFDDRFWNGASAGLAVGPLGAGIDGVRFELANMHPTSRAWGFSLPRATPRIQVDGRGGAMVETAPVVSSVVIEPDLDLVSVVWRGTAPAKRRYALPELMQMPLLVDWE